MRLDDLDVTFFEWLEYRVWRRRWCFTNLHAWCLIGTEGSGDYWYVGKFWKGPRDWRRFCADCALYRGKRKYPRPKEVTLGHCSDCRRTDHVLIQDGGHPATCRFAGDPSRMPNPKSVVSTRVVVVPGPIRERHPWWRRSVTRVR